MIQKRLWAAVAFVLLSSVGAAQDDPSPDEEAWSFTAETDLYMLEDVDFLMPTFSADRAWLHLEGRWNYEDLETLSVWVGWNLEVGRTVQLSVTPMIGGLVGRTKGVAPGLDLSLSWWRFELASQSEHVFDREGSEGDFFYNWSEANVRLLPWLSVGLAAQRTRLYQSEREIERGVLVSLERGAVSFSLYGFNLDQEGRFAIVALSVGF